MPHVAPNSIAPAKIKDIFYSFIGNASPRTHPLRQALLRMPLLENCVIKARETWHFHVSIELKEEYKKEYQDVLARSRYSLCPRGAGPGTIRFWESLRAGAIPVVFADDLALPAEVNWDDCIIRIPEKDLYLLNNILQAITPERETQLRENCCKVYELFSGENFVRTIRLYYGETE